MSACQSKNKICFQFITSINKIHFEISTSSPLHTIIHHIASPPPSFALLLENFISSPSFWRGCGGGKILCRDPVSKSLGGPKVDSAFHPSDQMSIRNFWDLVVKVKHHLVVALQPVQTGHKVLKSFFDTIFQLLFFHRNSYLLRMI